MERQSTVMRVLVAGLACAALAGCPNTTGVKSGATVSRASAGPCTGAVGKACWLEVENRPGCSVWNPNPQEDETVSWSGECAEGKLAGAGKETWRYRKDGVRVTGTHEGAYVDGKREGQWVYRRPADGTVLEGLYVDGKREGQWDRRYANGVFIETTYSDGKYETARVRFPNGGGGLVCTNAKMSRCWRQVQVSVRSQEPCFVESANHTGRQHPKISWSGECAEGKPAGAGKETWRYRKDGGRVTSTYEGSYVDGQMEGQWVTRGSDSETVAHYRNGVLHGHFVERATNGDIRHEGEYVNGKQHGRWVEWFDQYAHYDNGTEVSSSRSVSRGSDGTAAAIASGILQGIQAVTPVVESAADLVQQQRLRDAIARRKAAERQAAQQRQYEQQQEADRRYAEEQERQRQEAERQAAAEQERQRQEAERLALAEQARQAKEAEEARKADEYRRFRTPANHCVTFRAGQGEGRFYNKCNERVGVWYTTPRIRREVEGGALGFTFSPGKSETINETGSMQWGACLRPARLYAPGGNKWRGGSFYCDFVADDAGG